MHNTSESPEYRASAQGREGLTAIMLELLANGVILEDLVDCYKMFRFTGGAVPRGRWRLVGLASYLESPFAADLICTNEAQRYLDLAEEIMALGQSVATGRPRTLRARRDITNEFGAASAEIRLLGRALETGLAPLLQELSEPGRMHAFDGEQDFWPAEAAGIT